MAESTVNTPGAAYTAMFEECQWDLLDRLMRGTPAMRDARKTYLPQFPSETAKEYDARLASTFLYGMFSDTIGKFESAPFQKPVTLDGSVPAGLAELETDMDRAGTTLTQFAREWFRDALVYGMGHALVDFSRIPENEQGDALLAGQEEQRGARPTVLRITPPNLIDWQFSTNEEGERILSEIRFRSSKVVRDGFEQKAVKTVVHYQSSAIDFWEQVEKDNEKSWEPVGSVSHTFGRVPLASWYVKRTGLMEAKPPLLELAEVNLDHWQVFSDYKNLEHVVSVAVFFTKGFGSQEEKATREIGPKRKISAKNVDAEARWVEHSGAGIETLNKGLQKREERAEALGHEPTSRSKSPVTATGEVKDAQKGQNNLQSWVYAERSAIRQVYELAGEWTSTEIPEDFEASIYTDFVIGMEKGKEIDQLQKDADAGRITEARYLTEAKRRGLFGDDLDIEVEVEEAKQAREERASVMGLTPGLLGEPEEEEDQDEAA